VYAKSPKMPSEKLSQTFLSTIPINTPGKMQIGRIVASISENLDEIESLEIDFRLLGNIVQALGKALSFKVDYELLKPISGWQDDNKWLQRINETENSEYDWASYKRRQRQWTKQQKHLAAERLNRYRQEIAKNHCFRADVRRITDRSNQKERAQLPLKNDFIEAVVSPFSPVEQDRREINRRFCRALSFSVSDLLPWKLMIRTELICSGRLNLAEMKTYCSENKKQDTVSKLIHLLELEKTGEVELIQEKPFGTIMIRSNESEVEGGVAVIDQKGRDYYFDWLELNPKQRAKLIEDVKQHKILCRVDGTK
jgi:chromatin segregation and condensation protein Rec8/ScpA/Scc1 (kleisin family)